MDDTEAAPFSRGEILTWNDEKPAYVEDDIIAERAWYQKNTGFQYYDVYFIPDDGLQAVASVTYLTPLGMVNYQRTMPDYQEPPRYHYQSVAQAKAACEIHAVTGVFPPSESPHQVLTEERTGETDGIFEQGALPYFPNGTVRAGLPETMTAWEWYYGAPDCASTQWWTFTGTTYYEIYEATRRDQNGESIFIASCDADPDYFGHYTSLADAVAACEQREATGHWD